MPVIRGIMAICACNRIMHCSMAILAKYGTHPWLQDLENTVAYRLMKLTGNGRIVAKTRQEQLEQNKLQQMITESDTEEAANKDVSLGNVATPRYFILASRVR